MIKKEKIKRLDNYLINIIKINILLINSKLYNKLLYFEFNYIFIVIIYSNSY